MPPKKNARKVCGRFFAGGRGFPARPGGKKYSCFASISSIVSYGLICFDYGRGRREVFVVGIVAAGTHATDEAAIGR